MASHDTSWDDIYQTARPRPARAVEGGEAKDPLSDGPQTIIMRSNCGASVVGLCLVMFGPAPYAAAAAAQPPAPPAITAEVAVTLVELPVEVRRGNEPVEGLTAKDFQVRERGKVLPIVALEPIDLAAPPAPTGAAPAPLAPVPQAARRHLLLLFDFAFSHVDRLSEAVSSSRALLASTALHPSDLLGVGIYLPKGELSLLLSFTADRVAAGQALDALDALLHGKPLAAEPGEGDALRVTGASARALLAQLWLTREQNFPRDMLQSLQFDPAVSQGATREGLREGFLQANVLGHTGTIIASDVEEQRRSHVAAMVETVGAFGEALRWVEGRKHLLLFSEGFGLGIGHNPVSTEDAGVGLIDRLERVLASLRRDGWAVDSVDLKGLRGGGFATDGLFVMSDRTGGTLVQGHQDLARGVSGALARSARGYVLTVQVDVPYDGAYHELEVRVPNAGRVKVQHRGGFFAPIPFREQKDIQRLSQAAMLLGGEEERDELGVDWALVPLHMSPEGSRLGLVVEVPGAAIVRGSGNPGVDVYAYGFDGSGNSVGSFARTVQLDRTKASARLATGGLRVHGQLELPPGTERLRLLVRDRNDGRLSLLTASLPKSSTSGAGSSFEMLFLPPVGDPWLVVSGDAAFEVHGRRLLPAARASIPRTGQADLLLLGAGFTGKGESVRGRILGADGKAVDGGTFDLMALTPGGDGSPDMLIARVHAGTLASGEYLLEVRVASGSGPPRAAAVRHFRVVDGG